MRGFGLGLGFLSVLNVDALSSDATEPDRPTSARPNESHPAGVSRFVIRPLTSTESFQTCEQMLQIKVRTIPPIVTFVSVLFRSMPPLEIRHCHRYISAIPRPS